MSRQTSRAKDHYNLALQQYKRGEYLEAVNSVDKAISFGYRNVVVYDVKAAALSKLTKVDEVVWRDQAMDVIQQMCKQWGSKDWRPWHRKAEYLRSRGLFVHALSAIDKALDLVDVKNRTLVTSKQVAIRGEREAARLEQDRRLATATEKERKAIMEARRVEARSTQDFTQLLPPDILLLIADHLLLDNPSIGCRLSGVCRRWRDVLQNQPGVWSTLVLGGHRPQQKTALFVERSKGALRKLKLLPNFDSKKADFAGQLSDHVGQLKSLEFTERHSELIDGLRGRFQSLEHLSQTPGTVDQPNLIAVRTMRPDRRLLLDVTRPTLRSIRLESIDTDIGVADGKLAELRSIHLSKCVINYPSIRTEPLECLSAAAPLLERITLDNCAWYPDALLWNVEDDNASDGDDQTSQAPKWVMMGLIEYIESAMLPGLRFGTIVAPNLVRLELSQSRLPDAATHEIVDQLRARGLADALPNLQSLDISNHNSTQNDIDGLVELLSGMPSLRFLNLSFTLIGNDDDLLKALTWNNALASGQNVEHHDILPNLEGLSIAGLEITSIALRDLVLSRLPRPQRPVPSTQPLPTSTRPAFRPSSASTHEAQGSKAPRGREASSSSTTPASKPPSESPHPSPSGSQRRACLKWLCVDHCTSVDPQLPVYLGTKLPFVSHSLRDKKVIERIKGKGRYSWELDYYHSCADEGTEKCTVKRIEGSADKWRLIHHCGLQDAPYEPDQDADNVWESQWDPASTQPNASPIPDGLSRGDSKGWAKVDKIVSSASRLKRPAGDLGDSASSTPVRSANSNKARKGKGRMQISIGPDGSLTGF